MGLFSVMGWVQGFDRGHRSVIGENVKAFVLSGPQECVVEAVGGEVITQRAGGVTTVLLALDGHRLIQQVR